MRKFYSDPLAVAWMGKHFGMRIVDADGEETDWWECLYSTMGQTVELPDERFHIHPDSLHLLEPRAGDLLQGSTGLYFIAPPDIDPAGYDKPVKIIQRNGTTFHCPEVEQ